MQKLFIIATENAREKYTPKKYRSEEKAEASRERLSVVNDIDRCLEKKNNPDASSDDKNSE